MELPNMELARPEIKTMRQTNDFLRRYYTDSAFRESVKEDAAGQQDISRIVCAKESYRDIKNQRCRMTRRDTRLEQGYEGPAPPKSDRDRTVQRIAWANHMYKTDEAFREKAKAQTAARYQRKKAEKLAAEAALEEEAMQKLLLG